MLHVRDQVVGVHRAALEDQVLQIGVGAARELGQGQAKPGNEAIKY